MVKRAFFLDRDGVLNQEVNYLHTPEETRLIPGVATAMREIHRAGFLAVVVSNQAGVARGLYCERDIAAVHGDKGIPTDSPDGREYLEKHSRLIEWGTFNRRLIGKALGRLSACEVTEILNSTHNSITPSGDGRYIHRKGASAVEAGKPVIVAGSRGSFSYLVSPLGDGTQNIHSLAHGAGRKWNRQSTRDRVRAKHDDMHSLLKTPLGTEVICPDKTLLYEEAPEAYKEIESIIADLKSFHLASVMAELRPVVNIKP